jgi:hypothetical protein
MASASEPLTDEIPRQEITSGGAHALEAEPSCHQSFHK